MTSQIFLSSGDVIADRRFEWARDREAKGDLTGAADLLMQALELAPNYASAWFMLGELRERLGDRTGAVAAFGQAKAADPNDVQGATLRLTRLGVRSGGAMGESYVRALFDGYAPRFDQALTVGLNYRGPELLFRAIEGVHPNVRMKFGSVLDLGCGTGLAAFPLRPFSDWMVGVDLSSEMLVQARTKGVYDRLIEKEILAFLAIEAEIGGHYHLVLAADVFMYFDDLAPVLSAVAKVMDSPGLLAFSVETHENGNVILRDTLRYAHSETHVRAALAESGLNPVGLDFASTRIEKGVPVPGLIVVARH
jgi:predicted TPR repeat methyltransferase